MPTMPRTVCSTTVRSAKMDEYVKACPHWRL